MVSITPATKAAMPTVTYRSAPFLSRTAPYPSAANREDVPCLCIHSRKIPIPAKRNRLHSVRQAITRRSHRFRYRRVLCRISCIRISVRSFIVSPLSVLWMLCTPFYLLKDTKAKKFSPTEPATGSFFRMLGNLKNMISRPGPGRLIMHLLYESIFHIIYFILFK